MNNDINNLKQLINNLQLSVNNITTSFQKIQQIYKNSNNNLLDNNELINKIDDCYKYIDKQIEDLYIKTINDELIKKYIYDVEDKIKNLQIDNDEYFKLMNEKLNNNNNDNNNINELKEKINNLQKQKNNNIDNDLIIKNNLYINEKLDEFNNRLDDIQFNNTNNLRQDEIYKVRDIIHSQNDIYKCINDDIKLIKNDCNLLRNKIIDNFEDIIYITKNLQNQINELKLNTNIEELKMKFKKLKMIILN